MNERTYNTREACEILRLTYPAVTKLCRKFGIEKVGREYQLTKSDIEKIKSREHQSTNKTTFLEKMRGRMRKQD